MSTRCVTIRTQQLAQRNAPIVARRRTGFTVLEVMVAMFILLVGGLAILNIFPPALRVIRGSENREIAISMTQSALERYANEPTTIPDAVYNGDDTTGAFVDAPVAVAGTRIRNFSLPKDNTQAAFDASALSNVNNAGFRRIIGERHRVLVDGASNNCVLTRFTFTGTPNVYREDNIDGVIVDANGVLDFTDAKRRSDGSTFSNSTTPTLPLSTTPIFYVSYRWLDAANNVNGVNEERQDFSANYTVYMAETVPSNSIVRGQVDVRIRELLASGGGTTASEVGLLMVSAPVGDEVSVDYTVSDWRSLVFDTDATTPTSKALTAPPLTELRDIKLPIAVLSGQTLYALLNNKTPNGLSPQSAAIGQWGATSSPPVLNVDNLSATLSVASGTNPQARIAYQTSRGWAQQVSVAAKTYYGFAALRPASEREPWREYSWTPGGGTGRNLYFRASEAGKTVLVTFKVGTSTLTNQVVPIARDWDDAGTRVPTGANGFVPTATTKIARAVLLDSTGSPIDATAILSVRGASIRARTAWIENNNYVQEIKEDYRPLTD